ncbi:GDSL esterase/lipase 5 isoform X1 [Amborella trichopoda]|uniref:GDSL esterase/lipase 5 isoform X1 n=1 Tax=Amborella trichopoda TaxID=13333 RepID=UPI0005D3E61B|nr:GDSL esterase/lipase 5 isoform X1 [Amborella trichopoda]|eukprot:XP_011623491.1 GDSL esterase/lipase 5 isoform X1 [Amborella trichopoda]
MEKAFIWLCRMLYVLVAWSGVVVNGEKNILFVFGDSVIDSGTNNYIQTTKAHQANYVPYGIDMRPGASGRFSNGFVMTDYIAKKAKIPLIRPYLEPHADHSYGANFASGGAGVLNETNLGEVVSMYMQIEQFKAFKKNFTANLDQSEAHELIKNAVYFISVGINDYKVFINNYSALIADYNPATYVRAVVGNLTFEIMDLYDLGARKFVVTMPKNIGCSPAMRALHGGNCLPLGTELSEANNYLTEASLTVLEESSFHIKFIFFDQIVFMKPRTTNPQSYGFKHGSKACCGSGSFRGSFTCGEKVCGQKFSLCYNRSAYIYFDAYHCTQDLNIQAANALWEYNEPAVKPFPLGDFFNVINEKKGEENRASIPLLKEHLNSKISQMVQKMEKEGKFGSMVGRASSRKDFVVEQA